jgi:hypothetical protein
MSTSTIIFAMLPLALKLEAGGESRAPMAVVIIGGVISSTLLSLLLVPVMYTLLEDAKLQVGRLVGWRPAWRRRTPQAVPTDVVAPGHAAPASRHARVDTLPIQGGATDD